MQYTPLKRSGYLSVALLSAVTTGTLFAQSVPACNDGIDNDGDGFVDLQDAGCLYDGSNTSEADAGMNTATVDSNGNLIVIGSNGNDRITLSQRNNGDVYVRNGRRSSVHTVTGTVYVFVLGGNDNVSSTISQPSVFHGGNGDDYLAAGKGENTLLGGEGNDRMFSNGTTTIMDGGSGDDGLYPRKGVNIVTGGEGNDTVLATAGYSILMGGNGVDIVYGGRQNDVLIGGTTVYDSNLSALLPIAQAWKDGSDISTLALKHSVEVRDDTAKDTLFCRSNGDIAFSFLYDKVQRCTTVISEPYVEPNDEGRLLIENVSSNVHHQVLAGERSEELLAVSLTAVDGDVRITDLDFTTTQTRFRHLELVRNGAVFAHASRAACSTVGNTYCMRLPEENALVITEGTSEVISVRGYLKSDYESDVVSGEQFTIALGTAEGPTHETVLAKVSDIRNANPDADGTNVPVGQNYPIGQFAITTLQNQNTKNGVNDVEIDAFVFRVEYENVAFDRNAFHLYNKQDLTRTADCNVDSEQAATLFVSCPHLRDTSVNVEIDDGDTQTFVLAADISDSQVNASQPSRVQVSLKELDKPWRAVLWYDVDALSSVAHNWFELPVSTVASTSYETDAQPEVTRQLGDVNNDGHISGADAVLVFRHAVGTSLLNTEDIPYADVNKDGKVEATDGWLIQAKIVQLTELPAAYGDMNGNLLVQANDTVLVRRIIEGTVTPTPAQRTLADVNRDDVIDDRDVDLIRQFIGQVIPELPYFCGNHTPQASPPPEECNGGSEPATVTGRSIFYGNSAFGDTVAPDKQALVSGTATFANYTSYARGINGIYVDIENLAGTVTASDFAFAVGDNGMTGETWTTAPAPSSVTVIDGHLIKITWPDNAIQKQWLRVTVLANSNTGLAADDVHYWGNAIGETGNSTENAWVDGSDFAGVRDNPRNALVGLAPIDFAYDMDRDTKVNAFDLAIVRDNNTNFLNALKLITVTQ